jgi:Tol biopolymer transport system component
MMAASRVFKVSAAIAAALMATLLTLLTAAVKPAEAAFPGSNGAIAFTSDQDGNSFDIYRMAPDGFGGAYSAQLTDTLDIVANLSAWNAEGTRIAFVKNDDIWRMDASGNDETRLTINTSVIDTSPAWFPTDTKLAFVSNRSDAQATTDHEIYVMTLDENANPVGSPQQITTNPASDEQPSVSPDGKKIAFASNRDGDYEIYVMKAAPESATNKPVKLTKNTFDDSNPDWSPDGKRIVFQSNRDGDHEIFVMNADGTKQKNLTKNTGVSDIDPVFSPDGRRIAFERMNPPGSLRDIFRMRADGANQFNLTNTSGAVDAEASWQPN